MRYDTVLFDVDGTLLDFKKSEKEAIREALLEIGVSADDEMLAEYSRINDGYWKMLERGEIEKKVLFHKRFESFFAMYGIERDSHDMAARYVERLSTKGYLIGGADEICRELFGKVRMYIVTNGNEYVQRGRQRISGIGKYFDGVFISDCIGFEKPRGEFFSYVESHIEGFCKERTLIVGDSLTSDIKGGIDFGIDTCWYSPEKKAAPNGMRELITYTISDLSEVADIIFQGDR